jgi:hypothetical protein
MDHLELGPGAFASPCHMYLRSCMQKHVFSYTVFTKNYTTDSAGLSLERYPSLSLEVRLTAALSSRGIASNAKQINSTLRSALFWDITRRRVVIVYRRFGTSYRSHLQGSRVREEKKAGNTQRRFYMGGIFDSMLQI